MKSAYLLVTLGALAGACGDKTTAATDASTSDSSTSTSDSSTSDSSTSTSDSSTSTSTSDSSTSTSDSSTTDSSTTDADVPDVVVPDDCNFAGALAPYAFWRASDGFADAMGHAAATAIGDAQVFDDGHVGKGFAFNGHAAATAAADPLVAAGPTVTFSAWIRPDRFGSQMQVIGSSGQTQMVVTADGHAEMVAFDASATFVLATDPAPLVRARWVHLVGTLDASGGTTKIALYRDGVFAAEASSAALPSAAVACPIGFGGISTTTECGGTQQLFVGAMDEVAIWHRVLSTDEIALLHGHGVCGDFCAQGVCVAGGGPCKDSEAVACVPDVADDVCAGGSGGCDASDGSCLAGTPASDTQLCNDRSGCTIDDHCDGNGACSGTAGCPSAGTCQLATSCYDEVSCTPVTTPVTATSYWSADGDTLDALGGNNGSILGTVAFADDGHRREAFRFTPSQVGVVKVGDINNLHTFAFWVRVDAYAESAIYLLGNPASFALRVDYTGHVNGVVVALNPTGEVSASDPQPAPLGVWTHYVFTDVQDAQGTTVSLYRDGRFLGSANSAGTRLYTSNPVLVTAIGGQVSPLGDVYGGLDGEIDEVEGYEQVLSASDVADLYQYEAAGRMADGTACGDANVCCAGACQASCP